MNFKNIRTLSLAVLAGGLLFISCKDKEQTTDENINNEEIIEQKSTLNTAFLVGSWEDQSESALHFTLFADGTAKSDNMATLLYQNWRVENNQLYLTAKSIGNKSSSNSTDAYEILKLDENQMTLKSGEMTFEYKKVNNSDENLSINSAKTVKGKLILGHEANTFTPCGSDQVFWIVDKTGKLKNLYTDLTKNKKAYTPIFAEIEIVDKGKAQDGFPADYQSTYEVVNILKTKMMSDTDCE